mgnify:CR=1 FL=1
MPPHHLVSSQDWAAKLPDHLTDIAELLAKGRSNAEIAKALELSLFTVKSHVSNILNKLQLKNRRQAARYAQHHMH